MGQRSQIYVRITDKTYEDNKSYGKPLIDMVPMYYQWNYGERMVSRVANTCEWLSESAKYYFSSQKREHLMSILRTNFDMKDCVSANDIFLEAADYSDNGVMPRGQLLNDDVFERQDNNDGKAFIDVVIAKGEDGNEKCDISVCFTDHDINRPMSASEYLDWNYSVADEKKASWVQYFMDSQYHDKDDVRYTLDNIEILKKYDAMSKEQLLEFMTADYDKIALQHQLDEMCKVPYLRFSLRCIGNCMIENDINFNDQLLLTFAMELQQQLDAIDTKRINEIHNAGDDHSRIQKIYNKYSEKSSNTCEKFLEKKVLPLKKLKEETMEQKRQFVERLSGTEHIATLPEEDREALKYAILHNLKEFFDTNDIDAVVDGSFDPGKDYVIENGMAFNKGSIRYMAQEVMSGRLCDLEDSLDWRDVLCGGDGSLEKDAEKDLEV